MIINLIWLSAFVFVFFWIYKNIKKNGLLWLAKGSLQVGILILFIGGFFKLFLNLPHNIYFKIVFFIIYIWCTIGINVNLMIPLIKLIDQKIGKNV